MSQSGNLSSELSRIRRALNSLRIPWAVSGSMAMKLHANQLGLLPHRHPNDIDIVIREKDRPFVVAKLATIGYTSDSPPPVRFRHMKLHHGRFSIDLLAEDTNLAPEIKKANIVVYGKTPVVKINHLINQKRKILNNLNSSNARQNLNFLEKMRLAM